MTAGEDIRPTTAYTLSKLGEGLGWPTGGPGSHLVDLVRLVGYSRTDQSALDRVLDIAKVDHVPSLRAGERAARAIVSFEPLIVPGLLQTPEYAAAVALEDDVVARRELLRGPQPPDCTFYVHEAALHAWAGDWRVMADQVLQLSLWGASRHISIRLVPFAAGTRREFRTAFTCLAFPDGRTAVYTGAVPSERAEVVGEYRKAVGVLDRLALGEPESRSEFARWADHCERLAKIAR